MYIFAQPFSWWSIIGGRDIDQEGSGSSYPENKANWGNRGLIHSFILFDTTF